MGVIGSLFALPYEIYFFLSWIVSSLTKPLLLLTLLCVLSNPSAARRKLELFVVTVQYLVLCNDKKWKTPATDPASFEKKKKDDAAVTVERKTVIFVRHGESTWNDTFNKGDRSKLNFILYFIPNLLSSVAYEWYFWVTGQENESWFFDAPLSEKGKGQANGIQRFLMQDAAFLTPKERALVTILQGGDFDGGETKEEAGKKQCSSQLVSSNLRRAITTMALGFHDRLSAKYENDNILLLPALQEISRNPDALAITPAFGKVVPAWTDPKSVLQPIYESQIDTSKHTGNKPVHSNGLQRLREFCHIAFTDIDKDCIIAAGHSLWFRSFFRTFLPHNNTHVAKQKKLVNGGVVGFTLERIRVGENQYEYLIDPTSIVVLHGGF